MEKLDSENNWFKSNEKELLVEAARKRTRLLELETAKRDQQELETLREAHWLKCPKCGHDMATVTFDKIEIESCTFCKGVYFDRSEFESVLLRKTPQRFSFYRKFFGLD